MNDDYIMADTGPLTLDDEIGGDKPPLRQRMGGLLRGRWPWVIVLSLLLASALGTAGYFATSQKWRAIGLVTIERTIRSALSEDPSTIVDYDNYMFGQEKIIRSETVIRAAMESRVFRDAAGGVVDYDTRDFTDRLVAEQVRGQEDTIAVTFESEIPAVSQAAVQAVLESYRDLYQTRAAATRERSLAKLANTIIELERERDGLGESEMALFQEGDAQVIQARLRTLADESDRLKAILEAQRDAKQGVKSSQPTREEIGERDVVIRGINEELKSVEDRDKLLQDQQILPNHPSRSALEVKRSSLKRERDLQFNDIFENRRPIRLADGTTQPLTAPPDQQDEVISKLEAEKREVDAEARKLQERLQRIRDLADQKAALAKRIADVQNFRYSADGSPSDAERLSISGVALPSEPINQNKRLQLAGFGALVGGGLGFGLILMLASADRRLRHVEDARVGMPPARMLGILPTLPDNLSDPEQGSLAAHSVHHIRTLLQVNGQGRNGHLNGNGNGDVPGRVYSITSPAAGSGKSSLTMALGLSYAASGARTLLIDADVVGGGLTRRLGAVKHRPIEPMLLQEGLVSEEQVEEARRHAMATGDSVPELLVELGYLSQRDLDRLSRDRDATAVGLLDACGCDRITECVAETGVPQLYVLPIGDAQPQDAGSLSPAALRRIIAQAREAFDVVLLDTGPMLGSLEASMVATEVDGVIFVVSRGDNKTVTQRSLTMLHDMQAPIAGIVFNHASPGDLARSSHSALSSVQSRRSGVPPRPPLAADPEAAARYGPLASAVAAYGSIPRTLSRSNGSH